MLSTLANDSITLHFQPLVGRKGEVLGFEALMRWHHRQRGDISPEAFIPVFEGSGLMLPLSRWALDLSCQSAASWPQTARVWINVSRVQVANGDLAELVRNALARNGLSAERMEVEVREETLLADPGRAAHDLCALDRLGVSITLDRVVGGHSVVTTLADFPISKVKLDGTLVGSIVGSAAARSIVEMLVDLCHGRNLVVASSGIETGAQFDLLAQLGCDIFQGFLIGRPAPLASYAGPTEGSGRQDGEPELLHPHFAPGVAPSAAQLGGTIGR